MTCCSAEHDYNYLIAFCKAFETLNPGSIAKIYITDQEHFDGFCLCFRPQMLRIVRANFRVFTLDAGFIRQEKSKLKGWALYTLYSMDSNANLVCLAHCLYDQENQEGYDRIPWDWVYDNKSPVSTVAVLPIVPSCPSETV